MKHYTRYVMACSLQSRNQLEDRRSKDDKMSERMWQTVKTKARKFRMAETERRRREKREIYKKKKKKRKRIKRKRRRRQREVV